MNDKLDLTMSKAIDNQNQDQMELKSSINKDTPDPYIHQSTSLNNSTIDDPSHLEQLSQSIELSMESTEDSYSDYDFSERTSDQSISDLERISISTPRENGVKPRVQFCDIPLHEADNAETSTEGTTTNSNPARSNFFNDNIRIIDFVLVYIPTPKNQIIETMTEKMRVFYRGKFEEALIKQGLELEYVPPELSLNKKTAFIKVHTPFSVLLRQAELLNLRKPFMVSDIENDEPSLIKRLFNCIPKSPFSLQEQYQLPKKDVFSDVFERERKEDFLNHDDEMSFFTPSERIYLTWDILNKTTIKLEHEQQHTTFKKFVSKYKLRKVSKAASASSKSGQNNPEVQRSPESNIDLEHIENGKNQENDKPEQDENLEENDQCNEDDEDRINSASFQILQQIGVYEAGFPLHDTDMKNDPVIKLLPAREWPLRTYLHESWARMAQWRRHQPLQKIRDYYGDKMAMYFAFIGFYTKMLILPSIVGLLVTIYGLFYLFTDVKSNTICHDPDFRNIIMCPECATGACTFTAARTSCVMSKIAAVFDNNITIFFSIFIAIWAICFLELWKRYRSKLCADWNISDDDEETENIRFDYVRRAPNVKLNPVTMKLEPHVRYSYRLKRILASLATVAFFICVVIGSIIGIMLYKMVGQKWWKKLLGDSRKSHAHANDYGLAVSISASVANGVLIAIATWIYTKVAWFLTVAEIHRTDKQFEESYINKVFIFQCVNFYAALFYLAFYRTLRLIVVNVPHEQNVLDARCPLAGCLVEVTVQLAIIFVGKQAINNIMEIGKPLMHSLWKKLKTLWLHKKHQETSKILAAWERDYQLEENERCFLFSDYLELLIQYGFVTMFVAAFPLAPLFAFLNNIFEIRLDAYKNIAFTRRCIPHKTNDIGPWYKYLEVFTKVAVLTNALVIAFTTNLVDRLVYNSAESSDIDYRYPEWYARHNITDINATNPKYDSLLFRLSIYNTSDYFDYTGQISEIYTSNYSDDSHPYCYYVGYRYSPDDVSEPYGKRFAWWDVLGTRLLFVVIFENAILIFQAILAYLIPDVPGRVQMRMAREKYLIRAQFLRREFGIKDDVQKTLAEEEEEEKFDFKEFVPDELPEWLTSEHTVAADSTTQEPRRRSRNFIPEPVIGKRNQRSKIIDHKRNQQKRPFLIMIFRKLMLCN